MSSYSQVRELLEKYDLKAKKSWGQNFLVDDLVYEKIVHSISLPSQHIIEIGSGLGTLTERLSELAESVIAVERDPDMISLLEDRFQEKPKISVHRADAQTYQPPFDKPYSVVGNLPYHIGTKILFHILQWPHLKEAVFMFQKEVGERFLACSGTRKFSALSVKVQRRAQVSKVCDAGRESFFPAPKVESIVVRFVPREVINTDLEPFDRVVTACFARKRKTLQNSLLSLFQKDEVATALEKVNITKTVRAESLEEEDFVRLTKHLADA